MREATDDVDANVAGDNRNETHPENAHRAFRKTFISNILRESAHRFQIGGGIHGIGYDLELPSTVGVRINELELLEKEVRGAERIGYRAKAQHNDGTLATDAVHRQIDHSRLMPASNPVATNSRPVAVSNG